MWKNKKENEPNTEGWKRIINDLAKIGAVTLTFSGGEPFLRSDLFELASHAKSQGLIPMVVTNLSLFNKDHIEKIAENFDFIGISLDTIHPEMYIEIRGKDWLEQIKQNIHLLMDGLSTLKAQTEVSAVVTISNRNADEIHELIHMVFDELNMDTITFYWIQMVARRQKNLCQHMSKYIMSNKLFWIINHYTPLVILYDTSIN
jgi:MoaA/NifB/PqqE/SkfB family radical SAM enzyme